MITIQYFCNRTESEVANFSFWFAFDESFHSIDPKFKCVKAGYITVEEHI
jgi:hypothetical protein